MYFWNVNGLKKQIVEKGLSETQVFYYILLSVFLTLAAMEVMPYLPIDNPNTWNYLQSAVNLLIPTAGTILAYRANRGAQGKDFAAKYFSIGFVMSIRFLVYFIPLILVLGVYYALTVDWSSPEAASAFDANWFEVALFSAWYAALYARIVKHIGDTAGA